MLRSRALSLVLLASLAGAQQGVRPAVAAGNSSPWAERARQLLLGIDLQAGLVVRKRALHCSASEVVMIGSPTTLWSHEFLQPGQLTWYPGGAIEVRMEDGRTHTIAAGASANSPSAANARAACAELEQFLRSPWFVQRVESVRWESLNDRGPQPVGVARLGPAELSPQDDAQFLSDSMLRRGAMELLLEVGPHGSLRSLELEQAYDARVIASDRQGGMSLLPQMSWHPYLLVCWEVEFSGRADTEAARLLRAVGRGNFERLDALLAEYGRTSARRSAGEVHGFGEEALVQARSLMHGLQHPLGPVLFAGEASLELPETLVQGANALRERGWFADQDRLDPGQLAQGPLEVYVLPEGEHAYACGEGAPRDLGGSQLGEWPLSAGENSIGALLCADLAGLFSLDVLDVRRARRRERDGDGHTLEIQLDRDPFRSDALLAYGEDVRPRGAVLYAYMDSGRRLQRLRLEVRRKSPYRYTQIAVEGEVLLDTESDRGIQLMTHVLELEPVAGPVPLELACAAEVARVLAQD